MGQERVAETPREEVKKVNLARERVYAFLSRAFKLEVDEVFLKTIAEIQPTIERLSESQPDQELKEGNNLLLEFTKHVSQLNDKERTMLLTDLAVEYASLFLGAGQKPVHLVESVYLSKDHILYQEPYQEILAAYKSLGFEKEKDFAEPEDHVALELQFMANLCGWSSQTLQKDDVKKALAYLNLQNEFLTDHIMRWVPELCRRLDDATTSGFYRAIARLTSGFIRLDSEMPDYLSETLNHTVSAKE